MYLLAEHLSKKSVSPFGECFFFIEHHYGCDSFFRETINLQIRVSPQGFFFARIPKIRRIVGICDIVNRFLRKLFWFFLRSFSISDSMWLSSRGLEILVAMKVKVIPR